MSSQRSKKQSEERRELGGYSEAEFDAEFVRTQRSDIASVAVRAVTLVIVYGLLARALTKGELGAAYLWMPMAFEFLLVFWLGLLLAYVFVDCDRFAESARKPKLTMFWTLVVVGSFALAFAWDGEAGSPSTALLRERLPGLGDTIIASGLVWAFVVGAVMLGASTAIEVRRWRQLGCVFVWTSIIDLGLRGAALLILTLLMFFVVAFLSEVFNPFETPRRLAWVTYGFLLVVEVAALVLGVAMHRDLMKKAGSTRAVKARHY